MIDNPREYDLMAEVETEHWWYRTLHKRVLRALEHHFNRHDIAILDAGCGTGGLMHWLRTSGYTNLIGFDLSDLAVQYCRSRNLDASVGDLGQISDIFPQHTFDCIISNDTLYHVAEQQRAQFLQQAAARLAPGGLLILNLPALQCLRGSHDKAVGITHRFTKSEISGLAERAGLDVLQLRYWPFTLTPAIWLVRTWQRMFQNNHTVAERPKSDLKSYSKGLNRALYTLLQFEARYLPAAPFGSSLFVTLARR